MNPKRNPKLAPKDDNDKLIAEIKGMLLRRRWWLAGVFCIVAVASLAAIRSLPNIYESDATLAVGQRQVSTRFIDTDITSALADAVNSTRREIMSRAFLLRIIDELNLFPEDRGSVAPDLLIERVRKDIAVDSYDFRNNEFILRVAFKAEDPYLAQRVTSRLTSVLVEENMKLRGSQAEATEAILSDGVKVAEDRLAAQERQLQIFKSQHLGQLPEQQAGNVAVINGLQNQLQENTRETNRARQRIQAVESSIADRIARLQSTRTQLMAKWTPQHPEMLKLDKDISNLSGLLESIRIGSASANQPLESEDLRQLRDEAVRAASEINDLKAQDVKIKGEIREIESRIAVAPLREQQLQEIQRDYNLLKDDYTNLKSKQIRSGQAAVVETKIESQYFRLLDPPALPTIPSSPNRRKLNLLGLAAALGLAVAVAFVREKMDQSYHTEAALRDEFEVPFVLGIPVFQSKSERRAKKYRRVMEWAGVTAVAIATLSLEAYAYLHG